MGRKSSAKTQARPGPPGSLPPESRRSVAPLIAIAVLAALIVGVFAFNRGGNDVPTQNAAPAAAQAIVDPPPAAALGPHPQENLPAIPFDGYPPARPAEVVRAVYKFAAEHPEILSYVPCYCGCEREGHRGNEDCFVARRNAKGDVTEWDPHGVT